MGFTTPCFIRKNTPELRKKLEELGYEILNSGWGNARKIAEIPSYMYPQIRDKECYVFNNLELYQNF